MPAMKTLRISLTLALVVTTYGFVMPQTARAAKTTVASSQILITAIVPERRGIIIDSSQTVIMFYSNTPNSVTPEVRYGSITGPVVPMTLSVSDVYSKLMSQIAANKVFEARLMVGDPLKTAFPQFIASPPSVALYAVRPSQYGEHKNDLPYVVQNR